MSESIERLTAALTDRYTVERELGQGGMATVYLAHDVKHDRDVAIKVLHADLGAALGADRFLSEIRTTARLQHPHILPLLDSGDANGLLYYVMPLVTGETLRARLERERQLPVDDAIQIAREVADALGYAHTNGVIHRDIKPENILLQGGHALVADFGIALAVQQAGGARMTQTGLSLGTPQYMSPEQAMGEKTIDARSDIYALGAVTYEMLVGEPPFTGPSVQAIVARLVTEEPRSITVQRKAVPLEVEAVVLRALEKLPADRFATAIEFAEALAGRATMTRASGKRVAPGPQAVAWQRRFVVASVIAAFAIVVAAWAWWSGHHSATASVERRYVTLGDSVKLQMDIPIGPPIALSSDGSLLAFIGDTSRRIWIKRRDALDPTPIAGTEHASDPVFSPDDHWIAYIAGRELRKVAVTGGPSVTLADSAGTGYGIAWLDDGDLVYTDATLLGIRRVAQTGGAVSVLLDDATLQGNAPMLATPLPGSRGVLFVDCASNCVTMSLNVMDFKTHQQHVVVDNASRGWYLPTGQLFYVRADGIGLVVPFDLVHLKATGTATPVLQGVSVFGNGVVLELSRSGTVVYGLATASSAVLTMLYADDKGAARVVDSTWAGAFNSFAISPDGRRAAVGVSTPGAGLDIWVKQLPQGPFARLTFSGHDRRPAWSPDGQFVAFIRDSVSGGDVYVRAANGGGAERRLTHLNRPLQEVTWSHDGRWLLVRTDNSSAGNGDILAVRTTGDSAPVPVAASRFTELQPALSPDDRWLAYVSNDAGRSEVYVRPFPTGDGSHWQVSNSGGGSPVWSRDGKTLYFLNDRAELIAASVTTAPTFGVTSLTRLFDATHFDYIGYHQVFELTADGHFAFMDRRGADIGGAIPLVEIDNWFADLKKAGH
ncbi:MAG TPA: protein kinase [Gemmatimonadales bacterium]|jgi:serine/threonine-protein kinase